MMCYRVCVKNAHITVPSKIPQLLSCKGEGQVCWVVYRDHSHSGQPMKTFSIFKLIKCQCVRLLSAGTALAIGPYDPSERIKNLLVNTFVNGLIPPLGETVSGKFETLHSSMRQ